MAPSQFWRSIVPTGSPAPQTTSQISIIPVQPSLTAFEPVWNTNTVVQSASSGDKMATSISWDLSYPLSTINAKSVSSPTRTTEMARTRGSASYTEPTTTLQSTPPVPSSRTLINLVPSATSLPVSRTSDNITYTLNGVPPAVSGNTGASTSSPTRPIPSGLVIGLTVVGSAVLAVAVALLVYIWKRKRQWHAAFLLHPVATGPLLLSPSALVTSQKDHDPGTNQSTFFLDHHEPAINVGTDEASILNLSLSDNVRPPPSSASRRSSVSYHRYSTLANNGRLSQSDGLSVYPMPYIRRRSVPSPLPTRDVKPYTGAEACRRPDTPGHSQSPHRHAKAVHDMFAASTHAVVPRQLVGLSGPSEPIPTPGITPAVSLAHRAPLVVGAPEEGSTPLEILLAYREVFLTLLATIQPLPRVGHAGDISEELPPYTPRT
ncbi:hypothetical protein BC628DRAFT_1418175 [Trametes gibbosa]|nr:hypothetical protein BC628DRAFT_1418175 [Trametes gibbosa]